MGAMIHMYRTGEAMGYDEDVELHLQVAALHAQRTKSLVVPETLLLALLEDVDVAGGFGSELEPSRAQLEADGPRWPHERASSVAHWSQPARDALGFGAWRTVRAGRRRLTRGDVLSGLTRSGGIAGPLATRLVPERYDRIAVTPDGTWARPGWASVFVVNDDATTMDFVVHVLCGCFGLKDLAAISRMMRTHKRGSAHVGSWPRAEAEALAARARAEAKAAGFPLGFDVS